jgi:hypothetical protein
MAPLEELLLLIEKYENLTKNQKQTIDKLQLKVITLMEEIEILKQKN